MKATSIIRPIDDLGRIFIPKEIRKKLMLRVGENLEIYIDKENNIVLKKFSVISKISDLAQKITNSMNIFTKYNIIIMDTNEFIACSGPLKKEILNQSISDELRHLIEKREIILQNHLKDLKIMDNKIIRCSYADSTILVDGEAIGLIMILSEQDKLTNFEMMIVEIVSSFLKKYLEQY